MNAIHFLLSDTFSFERSNFKCLHVKIFNAQIVRDIVECCTSILKVGILICLEHSHLLK